MRIAWVTPYLPEPAASGGAIRQQRLARAVSEQAELHLFARGELWERARLQSPELAFFATRWLGRDYFGSSDEPPGTAPPPRRAQRGSPRSLWRALSKAHSQTPFDGVIVSHSWAARGAHAFGLPWLLDEHNIESRFFLDLARARGVDARSVSQETLAFERWERQTWTQASAVTCVSAEDAASIAPYLPSVGNAQRTARVVRNGADLGHFSTVPASARPGGVLFVGSLQHWPNVLAAQKLILHILPKVWRLHPKLELTIVGGPVPAALQAAARSAPGRVLLSGRVADVTPYLSQARVFANPVEHGAGSSLKTIEALAAGVPLVSTELGARGFSLVPGQHYAQAESADEFAAAILKALAFDPSVAARVAAGNESAQHQSWSALGREFASHVASTFAEARRPQPAFR